MRIKGFWAIPGFLVALSALPLTASDRLEMKLRVFEGARQGTLSPPESVTTSYIRPTLTASLEIQAGAGPDKEKEQIQRVFNLRDATLLTEADLVIGEGGQSPDSVRHFFRLNGNAFMIVVLLKESGNPNRFLVLFNEMEADKAKNILTTEMLLAGGHRAVFGFEDRQGKPYFCSFHITGPPDRILPPPPPPPPAPPLSRELKKSLGEFESGAVKAWNEVKPPRLIKSVQPVYPEEARKGGVTGAVVLNVRTDKQGNVSRVIVLKSDDERLIQAAIDAIKQWKYEPFIQDGQAKEVVFTVTVQFKLQ
jgi:TonB family protein